MHRRRLDRTLLLNVAALLVLGLLTLYSTGQTDVPTVAEGIWRRQAVWMLLGMVGVILAFRFSPRLLEWATPFIYGVAILSLVLTLVVGTGAGTAAATRSWLAIGGIRVGQPAELAKLATVLMLARHFGGRREPPGTLTELLPSVTIVGIPFVLVGLQPDLGSGMVFLGVLLATLFWSGVRLSLVVLLFSPLVSLLLAFSTIAWGGWLILLTALLFWVRPYVLEGAVIWGGNVTMGVIALSLWRTLAPYQQNRLLSFLNPELDPRATGWHIIQSKVAIGSGGLLGKGFTEGTQKRLAFLPEQHTDFIFSVVGEELGFVGVALALGLFAWLVLILVRVARSATDGFSSMLAMGCVGIVLTHVLVNVGMTVGLMPIVGIPLPFFSYGGSFLLTMMVTTGLVARVAWESRSSGYADL